LGKDPSQSVRPSQRSSVETPGQPAPEAPVRCLVDQAGFAPVAAGRGGLRGPSSSETPPGPGLGPTSGHQRRHDINRATISRQYKPYQLREVIGTGTWNTRTMRTVGKVETVESEMERRKIGCLDLSETRWSGKGDFVTDAGSTVIYSGT